MITDKMLEENTTPWGLLDSSVCEALFNCEELQHYHTNGIWYVYTTIRRNSSLMSFARPTDVIRKKPKPLTKPVIPWDAIKEEYKWAAKDEEDNLFIFTVKPKLVTLGWWGLPEIAERYSYGEYRLLKGLAIDFGTCDWKESLVERPK